MKHNLKGLSELLIVVNISQLFMLNIICYCIIYIYIYYISAGGFYCPGGAVITPSLPCSAGFYCKQGAMTSTPQQGQYADVCPHGHYCTEGTDEPFKCPLGTFANTTKLRAAADCTPCTPGMYLCLNHPQKYHHDKTSADKRICAW